MTDALPRSLDPETARRVAQLEVRARHIVEGSIWGRHQSPFLGQSIEFVQHRPYVPGDDLRHIDWKVWGRADRLSIKQYEDETNLSATLLVDASASMDYGSAERNKYEHSCQLAAALAYLLLGQSDAVSLLVADGAIRSRVPPRNALVHLSAILTALCIPPSGRQTELAGLLESLAHREHRRGMVFLFSDLWCELDPLLRGLRALRQSGQDVVLFHILHPDEIEFPFEGTVRFEGIEEGTALVCDPRALRDTYLERLQTHRSRLRSGCGKIGVDYRSANSDIAVGAILSQFVHERAGRAWPPRSS